MLAVLAARRHVGSVAWLIPALSSSHGKVESGRLRLRRSGPRATSKRAAADTRECGVWQLIYDEIHAQADRFQNLADDSCKLAVGVDDASLSWRRLYGILVWMKAARPRPVP